MSQPSSREEGLHGTKSILTSKSPDHNCLLACVPQPALPQLPRRWGVGGQKRCNMGRIGFLLLEALLFFDFRQLVHQRHLALRQKGCRGRKVALGQPL